MANLAGRVEHRHVEPRVRAAEPGRPHDGLDAERTQVEAFGRGIFRRPAQRHERPGRLDGRGEAGAIDPPIDAVEQAGQLDVGRGHVRNELVAQVHPVAVRAGHAADEPHAASFEHAEVECRVVGPADELQRRLVLRDVGVVHLIDALVEEPHRVEPPENVTAAVPPRQPHVASDGQRDGPPRRLDLVGDLDAGRGGADDEHAALGQARRTAVLAGHDLQDVARDLARERRHERHIAVAGGHHHVGRPPGALIGRDLEGGVEAPHPQHRRLALHRRVERAGVLLEIGGDLRHGHVAVRVGSGVAEARQTTLPVRSQQTQRVPSFTAPALGHPASFEDHVVDATRGETAARRETGLPAADDDGVGTFHGRLRPVAGRRPAGQAGSGRREPASISRR